MDLNDITLDESDNSLVQQLNPWQIDPEKEEYFYNIKVACQATLYGGNKIDYAALVYVPSRLVGTGDIEQVATLAFLEARKNGLQAPLMAYCWFAAYAHREKEWQIFDPAEGNEQQFEYDDAD